MDKAYFPYGNKSKEFLIKRTLFLCQYLYDRGVDYVILACNTLSIVALPFVKKYFPKTKGVFEEISKYINKDSAILGSKRTCKELENIYPDNLIVDGSNLIYKIENNYNYDDEIEKINKKIGRCSNIILACTHFLSIKDGFNIKCIKNKNKDL